MINVLPKEIAELIAAGEVVERPASVVKETVENSIDAGSRHITVEISRGGITFIRITDDGCGIPSEDVKKAFMRHATSKIKSADDLDRIVTLGFRGEALAAAAAVSRIEIFTKTADESAGTHYKIEGGRELLFEEAGCPEGTTLVIRDIFYNTPARMKFLKKDATEGTAVASVVERAALSHPEIAFKLIRDGKQVFSTSGDGKLMSAIYSVLGREFSQSLIPVDSEIEGISVSGYTCKPVFCKASRSGQFVFLNGRLIRSNTVMAAVEQAYKNSSMVGKFPAFVLSIKAPYETVDVNYHPAKIEVRFSDERRIFSAVHYAVKNAISALDTRPEITPAPPKAEFFVNMSAEEYRQSAVKLPPEKPALKNDIEPLRFKEDTRPLFAREENIKPLLKRIDQEQPILVDIKPKEETKPQTDDRQENAWKEYSPEREIRLIGEAFKTYIAVERDNSIYIIDKHAAHERIIFNRLKQNHTVHPQPLLVPVTVKLTPEEYDIALSSEKLLLEAGIELEDFGEGCVVVRSVPSVLGREDVESVLSEAVRSIEGHSRADFDLLDDIFHTVACKAAIKAGYNTTAEEQLSLAIEVLEDDSVMYCPHGRPVAFRIKKSELEKYFGRIQ